MSIKLVAWCGDISTGSTKKKKSLTLGQYSIKGTTLAKARVLRDDAAQKIRQGVDPAEEKKQHKEEAKKAQQKRKKSKTFVEVSRGWIDFKSLPNTKRQWSKRHARDVARQMAKEVYPIIGTKLINEITIDDVEAVLNPIQERQALDVLGRALGRVESVFRFAKVKRYCENNPADGLREFLPSRETQNMAYVKEEQLPKFLQDLESYQGDFICKQATIFVLLSHLRTKEVRFLHWSDVDFDNKTLTIPKERMKMPISQTVPLSRQALSLLQAVQSVTSQYKYIFTSLRNSTQPISENGMLSVIYRMGYKGKTTIHGLRSTYSTIANETLKFRYDVVEAALAHKVKDPVRAAYCHATYLEERAENIQIWSDEVITRNTIL